MVEKGLHDENHDIRLIEERNLETKKELEKQSEGLSCNQEGDASDHEVYEKGGTILIDNQHVKYKPTIPGSLANSFDESSQGLQVRPWKHQTSHPLENIIIDPTVGFQTSSSMRNLYALTAFLSQIRAKNINEALKDPD